VLGKTVKLNGLVRTIVAVAPPGFNWPEISDFWIPTGSSPATGSRAMTTSSRSRRG
jgi:hypothetical protein